MERTASAPTTPRDPRGGPDATVSPPLTQVLQQTLELLFEAWGALKRLTDLCERLERTWRELCPDTTDSPSPRDVPGHSPPTHSSIDPAELPEIRQWVLRAIAHYEAVAPRSIIDVAAIRMYLNEQDTNLLRKYNMNILSTSLHKLGNAGLLRVIVGEGKRRWRQYRLTVEGKRVVKKLLRQAPLRREEEILHGRT